jgi:hypothetical protein
MNTTIKAELEAHAYDQIQELHVYNSENLLQLLEDGDLHHKLFNEDYYIIGYYQAKEWLKSHKVDVFEGIDYCKSNEIDHFGENHTNYDNEETLVNHIVYWAGYDLDLEAIVNQVLEDEEEATIKLAKAIGGKNV